MQFFGIRKDHFIFKLYGTTLHTLITIDSLITLYRMRIVMNDLKKFGSLLNFSELKCQ